MRLQTWISTLVMALGLALPLAAHAQGGGEAVFNTRCKACHEPAIDRAPNRTTLGALPAATIVDALTNGVMKPMAAGLSDADKQAVAAYLTSAAPASQVATQGGQGRPTPAPIGVDVKCQVNPPIRATSTDWTSVGFDAASHRSPAQPRLDQSRRA